MTNSLETQTNITYSRVFQLIMVVLSFFCVVETILEKTEESFQWLYILPTSYLLINVIAVKLYRRCENIAISLIIVICFIRCCFIPCLLAKSNFFTEMNINLEKNFNISMLLMVYELVAVYFAMFVACFSFKGMFKRKIKTNNYSFRKIVIVLVAVCIGLCVIEPQILLTYSSLLKLFNNDLQLSPIPQATNDFYITIFSLMFLSLRIVLPVYLIMISYKHNHSEKWLVVLAIVFSFAQFLMISETFAESLISVAVIICVLIKLVPGSKKIIISAMTICIVILCSVYFGVYYTTSHSLLSISQYLGNVFNAYFTGICNVSGMFNVTSDNKWSIFFFSFYRSIPFNTAIFGLDGHNMQYYFNYYNHTIGQIQPTIGSGFFYFGGLFAPTFSVVFSFLAVKNGDKYLNSKGVMSSMLYALCAFVFSLGIGMYSESIVITYLVRWIFPIMIITKLSDLKWDKE